MKLYLKQHLVLIAGIFSISVSASNIMESSIKKVLTDQVAEQSNTNFWQYTIPSQGNAQYLSHNGWRYAFRSGGTPTFAISNNSYSSNNTALAIEVNNAIEGLQHSSYWYKDFTLTVPQGVNSYLVRMKIKNKNAGTAGWHANFFIKYREVGSSTWSSSIYSNTPQTEDWQDSTLTFNLPETTADTSYQVRVYPRLLGKGNGSVYFDDLDFYKDCQLSSQCSEFAEISPTDLVCTSGESRTVIELPPAIGTASEQRSILQQALSEPTNSCVTFLLNDNYFIDTLGEDLAALSLPPEKDIVLTGGGSITLAPKNVSSNTIGDYRTILAITGDPDKVNISNITIDHNANKRPLNLYDVKQGADLRSSISSFGSSTGFGDLLYSNITIKNADSVVSIYNNRHFDTANSELGRANSIILDNVTWLDSTNHGVDYDQSYLNADTDYGEIKNSTIKGLDWQNAPRTAFEPHFRAGLIENNTIENFQVGINLAGISRGGAAQNILVKNNNMAVSRNGILIWSEPLAPANAEVGLIGANIENNLIDLYPQHFQFYTPDVQRYRVGTGIYFYAGRNFNGAQNIDIVNNIINYHQGSFSYLNQNNSKYAGAIGGYNFNYSHSVGNLNQQATVSNLNISGNVINNCEAAGVYFYLGRIENLSVTNNTFNNCGNFNQDGSQNWYVKNFIVYIHNQLLGTTQINGNTYNNAFVGYPMHNIFVRDRLSGQVLINQAN